MPLVIGRFAARLAAAVLFALLCAPGAATAVSFGIADAPSHCGRWVKNSCASWSYGFASYYDGGRAAAFTRLKASLPLHYVRLFAPYDTVYDFNPVSNACRWSADYTNHSSDGHPDGGGPGSAWFRLASEIADARALGLQPLVVMTSATGDGQQQDGDPATPDPTVGNWAGLRAGTTIAGNDYRCGVEGLTYLTQTRGLPVSEWEAWNEPDGAHAYNGALDDACGSVPNGCGGVYATAGSGLCGAAYTHCGPLEAAGLYAILSATLERWHTAYGWAVPPLAAGTTSWPSTAYFGAYFGQLTGVIGEWPQYLAYHDYADVTADGFAESLALTREIHELYARAGRPQPALWITEAGAVLTDTDNSYDGRAIGCDNGEADDAQTLGACVDGSPSAQQAAASDFLKLPSAGAFSPGQITQLFWYQLQPANASTGWDSGLLAPPRVPAGTWAQASPDGVYGSNSGFAGLRASYCVLARISSASCSGASIEASDWSIQPRTLRGSLIAGQTVVSGVAGDQLPLADGDFVTRPGIPSGTVITSGIGTGSWSLSHPPTTSGAAKLTASG